MSAPDNDTARLFLALWPDAEVRAALARYADTWQWPRNVARVRADKLHLTLHFIGNVARSRIPELSRTSLPFEPFSLQLGCPEIWPHGIAVMRPHVFPAELSRLQAALGDVLRDIALPVDAREFNPHVTLARRAHEAVPPTGMAAIEWPVADYALVESGFDANRSYTVIARNQPIRFVGN
jgi:2'-5' RNA ligase